MLDIQRVLDEAVEQARPSLKQGKVATYIPELSKGNPEHLGACIATTTGYIYGSGDWKEEFTVQSISKTMILILALQNLGYEKVFNTVGVEPTGDAFNSLVKLETKNKKPLNPMINAGAIAVVSLCVEAGIQFDEFLDFVRLICKRDSISLNEAVYLSEKHAGDRNRSMAYLMHGDGIVVPDVDDVLDFYFKMCSISINAEDLANFGLLLANGGVDIHSGDKVISSRYVRVVKTLMITCGLYDGSGEYAIRVGMPGKSGVGGGIMSTVERQMGIGAFGPALDPKGNSIGAYYIMEYLSQKLSLNYFRGPSVIL